MDGGLSRSESFTKLTVAQGEHRVGDEQLEEPGLERRAEEAEMILHDLQESLQIVQGLVKQRCYAATSSSSSGRRAAA